MGMQKSLQSVRDAVQQSPAMRELIAQQQLAAQAAEHDAQQANMEREILLGALVESAYIVAAADGGLSDTEKTELAQGFSAITDVGEDELCSLVERVAPAVEEEGPKARFQEIAEVVADDSLREAAYLVACAVAWRDGGIGEKQGLALRGLKDAFGYSEAKHQQLLSKARQLL